MKRALATRRLAVNDWVDTGVPTRCGQTEYTMNANEFTLVSASPLMPIYPGRFEIGDVIGLGGMGEVRSARDNRVGREVAIKALRREDPKGILYARFLREVKIQALLDHPAIVPVYDLGVDETGAPYFAMKRLTGVTLDRVLACQRAGTPEVAGWTRRTLLD